MRKAMLLPRLFAFTACAAVAACTASTDNGVGSTSGALNCDDFKASGTIDANLDANVKVFLQATQELRTVSADIRGAVKKACIGIASDMGAKDTWSAHGDDDAAIHADDGSGACDVATVKIKEVMEAHADANFALVVTRGHCQQNFDEVKKCDQQCSKQETCTSGDVTTRCEPGQVSVVCEGKCKASAECEGTESVQANCMGKCESTCVGECHGTCTHKDGTRTDNDPNCNGKCSATCNGKCAGTCKVEATEGVECGASVRCKGECEGTVTQPTCETKCSPPSCSIDTRCFDVCTTQVQAKTVCEPSKVELLANVSVHADVQKLVTTINTNFSALVDVAEQHGSVVVDAANKLAASGKALLDAHLSFDARSDACAVTGASIALQASTQLATVASAGTSVSNECSKHAQ